jgi:hypothetical protein
MLKSLLILNDVEVGEVAVNMNHVAYFKAAEKGTVLFLVEDSAIVVKETIDEIFDMLADSNSVFNQDFQDAFDSMKESLTDIRDAIKHWRS